MNLVESKCLLMPQIRTRKITDVYSKKVIGYNVSNSCLNVKGSFIN